MKQFYSPEWADNYATPTYTWVTEMTPNKDIIVSVMGTACKHLDVSSTLAGRIYTTDGILIGKTEPFTSYSHSWSGRASLETPVLLLKGVTYYIGFYGSGHGVWSGQDHPPYSYNGLSFEIGQSIRTGSDSLDSSSIVGSGTAPSNLYLEYTLPPFKKYLMQDGEGRIKSFSDNEWIDIDQDLSKEDQFNQFGTENLDFIPIEKWNELNEPIDILLYTNDYTDQKLYVETEPYEPIRKLESFMVESLVDSAIDSKLHIQGMPYAQLVIPKDDINILGPTLIEKVTNILIRGTSDNIKVAMAFNGEEQYWTYYDNEWLSFTHEDINTSRIFIESYGMSSEIVNTLGENQWVERFGGSPESIRIMYLISSDTDIAIDKIKVEVNLIGSWMDVKENDYIYGYPSNTTLHVQLFNSGTYKINGLLKEDKVIEVN